MVLHLRTAKIHVAISKSDILASLGVLIELKRRRCRRIEYLQIAPKHFDFARLHVGIDLAALPAPHPPGHAQNVFVTNTLRTREALFRVRIEDNLHNAGVIPDIQENHSAMVPASVYPAAQLDVHVDV
jgi:hypothetical protein